MKLDKDFEHVRIW